MKFKVGDSVELIDEAIKGHIVSIKGNSIIILTEAGFEMPVGSSDIMKATSTPLHITRTEIAKALEEKEDHTIKKKPEKTAGHQKPSFMEVDLHIHELTNTTRGMGNYDMLGLQLDTARKKLEYAMENNIRTVVFIHGVGAGVLKAALEDLFNRYKNVSWYDADFRRYGFGATEVRIYRNS